MRFWGYFPGRQFRTVLQLINLQRFALGGRRRLFAFDTVVSVFVRSAPDMLSGASGSSHLAYFVVASNLFVSLLTLLGTFK